MITSSKAQTLRGVSWSFAAPHAPSQAPLFAQPPRFYKSTPQQSTHLFSPLLPPPFPNLAARRTSHQPDTPKTRSPTRAPGPVHPARSPPSPLRRVRPPVAGRAPTGEGSPHRSVRFSISSVLGFLGFLGLRGFLSWGFKNSDLEVLGGVASWFLVMPWFLVALGVVLLDFLDN